MWLTQLKQKRITCRNFFFSNTHTHTSFCLSSTIGFVMSIIELGLILKLHIYNILFISEFKKVLVFVRYCGVVSKITVETRGEGEPMYLSFWFSWWKNVSKRKNCMSSEVPNAGLVHVCVSDEFDRITTYHVTLAKVLDLHDSNVILSNLSYF